MNTVFLVSKAGEPDTRLILPNTAWSFRLRENLAHHGYSVQATTQDPDLVVRDEQENARREALFDLCAPL
jgi:hypothetical protein